MLINEQNLRIMICRSLREAIGKRRETPKLQSAQFVQNVAFALRDEFTMAQSKKIEVAVQRVNVAGTGKIAGELLLDAVVWEYFEENDDRYQKNAARFLKVIHWAVESESDTSLTGMASDFNKLLAVYSRHYLYLNGVNQKSEDGRKEYQARRLATVRRIVELVAPERLPKDMYFAFWPSPEQIKGHSLWEENPTTLEQMVNVTKIA